MKRLLLHTCCAPCMIYPLERFRADGYDVEGFFYNPNIHPLEEYNHRRKAVEQYARESAISVLYPVYNPDDFFHAVSGVFLPPERCKLCWKLRLLKTAQFAKGQGFDAFSSTLLVSPYQDIEIIKQVGEELQRKHDIQFYFEDFRPGFRKAHDEAKKKGMYCQKYCGCSFSENERALKKK